MPENHFRSQVWPFQINKKLSIKKKNLQNDHHRPCWMSENHLIACLAISDQKKMYYITERSVGDVMVLASVPRPYLDQDEVNTLNSNN